MHKFKKFISVISLLVILLLGTTTLYAAENTNNQIANNTVNNNELNQESSAKTLASLKDDQLKDLESYKSKYENDSYGLAAYILHLIQVYSIPIGIVGIAISAIYEYVIGIKKLDIRDKGFNTMIAVVTIIIICQVLPLIFAVVVKSTD